MDIRFTIERLLLRGLRYRLLLAAVVIALVAVTGGLLVFVLDPNFGEPSDAVWWSFLRLTDPGYLGDDEGAVSRSISTVLTVLGYVLFLGLLIAILTQWMNTMIRRWESGTTSLSFRNHIVILGWNHRTPSIVLELLQTGGRVTRFLANSGADKLRIVILAEHVDAELSEELRSNLGDYWDDRHVVLRSGSPLKLDGLERVAFHDAAAVILPGADFASTHPGVADSEIIKSLASISRAVDQRKNAPLAVAALYNANRGEVARQAYAGKLEAIAADQLVSRLMAQCTLHPGLWKVYWELFSLTEGNALYVRKLAGDDVSSIEQARRVSPNAVVVGVIPLGAKGPVLNPPANSPVKSGDSLIFIAKHYADCGFSDAALPVPVAQAPDWRPVTSGVESILILGWGKVVPKVVSELLVHEKEQLKVDIVAITPVEEREVTIDSVINAQREGTVRQVETNFMNPDKAAEVHPENYDAVLMIARERMGEEEIADAATLSAYLTVDTLLTGAKRPHIVAEVLEEENEGLFDQDNCDAIVSPMIISHVLSQVALEPELGQVFQELTQSRGTTFLFRSFKPESGRSEYLFSELADRAARRGETAIGVVTVSDGVRQTLLNPGAAARWASEDIEQVVMLGSAQKKGRS